MAQLLLSGTLAPGAEATWFVDNMSPQVVRSFTAHPYIYVAPPDTRSFEHFPPYLDTAVEITHIYYLLKGTIHETDNTGGTGTLQLNITLRNVSPDPQASVTFEVYMTET